MGAMPCVSTERSPTPEVWWPLKVGAVSALEDAPCDTRPFDHGHVESTRPRHSARIRRVTMTQTSDGRPRARGLGIVLPGEPGPLNAITDVDGVEVGVKTLIDGASVRTGVTAILPRGRQAVGQPCAAGWYSLNGNGEMTGTTWTDEAGSVNLTVVLSNPPAGGPCHTGVVSWVNRINPLLARQWLLPVCAETWDGYLNDINGGHIRPEHVEAALDAASAGPVAEGSGGGGPGMNC